MPSLQTLPWGGSVIRQTWRGLYASCAPTRRRSSPVTCSLWMEDWGYDREQRQATSCDHRDRCHYAMRNDGRGDLAERAGGAFRRVEGRGLRGACADRGPGAWVRARAVHGPPAG